MADIKSLKDLGIPLRIDGATRYVKGATKYTTCSDVIKMVLKKTGIGKEYRHMFAIFELSKHGEVPLHSGSRITKVMGAWGNEPNKFVLRKTDPLSQEPVPAESKGNLFKRTNNKKQTAAITSNYNHVMKVAEIISKHNEKMQRQQLASKSSAADSTDSDTSLEDFISQMDETKVAYLMNMFQAAIESKGLVNKPKQSKTAPKKASPCTKTSKVKKLFRRPANEKKKESSQKKIGNRTTSASDVHPNKMYGVQRVNYGFVDNFPESEPEEEFNVGPAPMNKTFVKSRSYDSRRETIYVPAAHDSSTSEDEDHQEVFKRNERFRRATRCREDHLGRHGAAQRYLEDSSTSSELDDAFMATEVPRCTRRRRVQGRRLRYFDVNRSVSETESADTRRQQKIVDYSITDDEFSGDVYNSKCTSRVFDSGSDIYDGKSDSTGISSRSTLNSYTSQTSRCSRSSDKISDAGYCTDIVGQEDDGERRLISQTGQEGVNVADYIKELFSKKAGCLPEDEEMDSFMRSRLADDFSDDGLSSGDSDKGPR